MGQSLYDRVFGTTHVQGILPRFEDSLLTNFTELDGSILPIRSEGTGFTIPGLCGALSDLVNALLCRGHLDHIARRMFAIFRQECVRLDVKTGELTLEGLVGADNMDPGNYKLINGSILPMLRYVAGEYGDEELRQACGEAVKKTLGQLTTDTGATRVGAASSDAVNSGNVRGALLRHQDWKRLIAEVSFLHSHLIETPLTFSV